MAPGSCEKRGPEMERDPIRRLVAQYKASFDGWIPEELYKWRAVQAVRERWNLEEADLAQMLRDALSHARTRNLLDSSYAYPSKMIVFFAEKEPETVRSSLPHAELLTAPGAAEGEVAFLTPEMTRAQAEAAAKGLKVRSLFRVLE